MAEVGLAKMILGSIAFTLFALALILILVYKFLYWLKIGRKEAKTYGFDSRGRKNLFKK